MSNLISVSYPKNCWYTSNLLPSDPEVGMLFVLVFRKECLPLMWPSLMGFLKRFQSLTVLCSLIWWVSFPFFVLLLRFCYFIFSLDHLNSVPFFPLELSCGDALLAYYSLLIASLLLQCSELPCFLLLNRFPLTESF